MRNFCDGWRADTLWLVPRRMTPQQAEFAVRRGAGVAQLLGAGAPVDGRATLSWVTATGTGPFTLTVIHAFDERDPGFTDIVEFGAVDPDAEPERHSFDTADQLVGYADSALGARPDRWVNESVIDAEYADWLASQPTP